MTDLIFGALAVILTLLVLSRILGDSPAFRFAQYLFIGLSLGYAFVVVYYQVLSPALITLIQEPADPLLLSLRITPFVLGALLLTRITNRQSWSWLANLPLSLIFGIAAALALAGAVTGTLTPQIVETIQVGAVEPLQLAGAIVLALGVIVALCYFYFTVPNTAPSGRLVAGGARVGRWLLIITFGFFLAGALTTYLTALSVRLSFVVNWFQSLFA